MLSEQFRVRQESGEEIPVSTCHCFECDNNFFVMVIHENEPKYCPYCGIQFVRLTTSEGEQREIRGE